VNEQQEECYVELRTVVEDLLGVIDDTFFPDGCERYRDDAMQRRAFITAIANTRFVLDDQGDVIP